MLRLLSVIGLAFAIHPLTASAAGEPISLRVAFRADEGSPRVVRTLSCAPSARGTVPRPADACRRLRRLGDRAFAPTPRSAACTEIFGGPSSAIVTGSFLGHRLWARLRRDNGCEIARWTRVSFLLPPPAAPS
jgi:hypothetical protein